MDSRLRAHLRSNVVGYLTLFFALSGGVAWATHPGGANTISSADLINGQVTTADIGNNQVRSVDVHDDMLAGGLGPDDLNAGSVGGSEVLDQSIGEIDIGSDAIGGDEVVTGGVDSRGILDGAVGAEDLGLIWRRDSSVTVPSGSTGSATANCLPGEELVGGGMDLGPGNPTLQESLPSGNGWYVRVANSLSVSRTVRAWALCLGDGATASQAKAESSTGGDDS